VSSAHESWLAHTGRRGDIDEHQGNTALLCLAWVEEELDEGSGPMSVTMWQSMLTLPVLPGRDHIRDPINALVTLVEYGDYECPHCGAAHAVVNSILTRIGHEIRFVFRHFPMTTIHPHAEIAAEAAEAAGSQRKFWAMHDTLYEHQQELDPPSLLAFAAALGLDINRFNDEIDTHRHLPKINEDFMSGVRSGVNGTPTFFVNGVRHDGAWDYTTLITALDAQIIALFAERIRPEPRPIADADSQALAELMARRRQVVEMIGMETNRFRQACNPRVQRTIRATLKTLEAQLAVLDREINDTVRGSPIWRAADDLLTSVPGVGDVTSRTLIADLPELGQTRSASYRRPGRCRPGQSRFRTDARQANHRRRPDRCSERFIYGNSVRDPLEPGHQSALQESRRTRTPKEGRVGRMHAAPSRYPQCNHTDGDPMAKRMIDASS
jgi:protein-disulfide isomerase